jgi:TonB-linked SusC/RagA family outer membrane protein
MMLFALTISESWAQERNVSGKVTDTEDGSSLPGVNVLIKGSSTGTITDGDGAYSLSVSDNATLIFSFIGYASQEVPVGSRSIIDIRMTTDATQLGEVVVTAIGLEANKRELGYSIQNVDANEIRNAAETNLVSALSGKAAGVQVTSSSGTPGASAQIRIRGNKSVSGSNSPLFVVDGIPIDNSSQTTIDAPTDAASDRGAGGVTNSNRAIDINPDDIASMTILKGPAATALYGIRAANGAVIITTKRGKPGEAKISFGMTYSFDRVNKLPDRQMQYSQGFNSGDDATPGSGVPTYSGPDTFAGTSWGPDISTLEYDGSTYDYHRFGRLVPAGTGNGRAAEAYDNADNFFQTAHTLNTNVNFSGGTEKSTYYASVSRLFQTGMVPNTEFERISTKFTIDSKLTDKLSMGFSGSYVNSGGIRAQQGSNLSGVMLGLMRTSPTFDMANGHGNDGHEFLDSYARADGTPRAYRGNLPGTNNAIYDNPYWTVLKNFMDDDVNRFIGYASLGYQLTPWLKASYKVGIDTYSDERKFRVDINSGTFGPGQVVQQSINNRDINSDFLFIIDKDISDNLHLDAILGHNSFSHRNYGLRANGQGLASRGFYNIASATTVSTTESLNERELYGVYGDFRLNYKDQYFLNFTGRNDWSSTLPESSNSFFYPAISGGWSFTETLDLGSKLLSYGKLRASWGQVGNDALFAVTDNSFTQSQITDGWTTPNGVLFPAFGINAFQPNFLLGNPALKSETTTTMELGTDLRLFDGKITADFTYFKANTTDNILVIDIPRSGGWQQQVVNSGEIENKGIEIALTATPIQNNNFAWDIGLNFTQYSTTVIKMAPGLPFITIDPFGTQRLAEGEAFGIFYGSRFLRDDQGRKVIGLDGIPLQDPNDGIVGDPTPDFLAGLRNTFTYKGFTLSALLDIRQGGDIWNGTKGVMSNFGVHGQTLDRNESVVFDGVVVGTDGVTPTETINTKAVIKGGTDGSRNYYSAYGFTGLDELNVEDGSFVRLRELSLSYSFSNDLLSSIPFLSRADVRVFGRNLFLITDYSGIDPETNLTGDASNVQGYDYFNNPNTRSYGVSLNVTF